jgi:dienelactone hydrolase
MSEGQRNNFSPVESTNKGMSRKPRRGWRWLFIPALILCAGVVAGAIKYHKFYYHVTAQEASHAVERDTFELAIRNGKTIRLHLYQQTNARAQQLVLFTSGDGGWSPFCADIAAHIAAGGRTVVGFDSKDYLTSFATPENPVTPEDLARDYDQILRGAVSRPGVNAGAPVVLSGWSLGAGFSVLAATTPELKPKVDRVVAISLPVKNELAWKATDAIIYITHGTPQEKVFDAHEYVSRMGSIPIVIMNASDDDTSPVKDAHSLYDKSSGPKKLAIVKAWGHHFEGGEAEFYQKLDEAFS